MKQAEQTGELNFKNILFLFRETDKKFKETARRFRETDKKFEETDKKFKETDKKFEEAVKSSRESDRKFEETGIWLKERSKESENERKELARQMKNLMKKMGESESRWGKFVESLVEGDLVKHLKKKGISVRELSQRERTLYDLKEYEIDLIARNGEEIVAVEVKTTLSPEDVSKFIQKLNIIKKVFPIYKDKKVYGAVAYISSEGSSEKMSENKGLFVIKATGDSSRIINARNFQLKYW